jgi:hypothetical protein
VKRRFYCFTYDHSRGHGLLPAFERKECPFSERELDGGTYLPRTLTPGMARVTWERGWTLIGFADCSGDTRPGSLTIFLAEGSWNDYNHLIEVMGREFPEITSRIKATPWWPTHFFFC